LMSIFSYNLDKNNIDYIIDAGTLLGSIRHGGLIPWDDDIDIMIIGKNIDEIDLMLHKILKGESNIIIKRSSRNNLIKLFLNGNYNVWVDVFPSILNASGDKYYLLPPWEKNWISKNELYPIKKYKFGPLLLSGPNDSKSYLNRKFPFWNIFISKYRHDKNNDDKNVLFKTINWITNIHIIYNNVQPCALPEY